jgi:hypothetical protein
MKTVLVSLVSDQTLPNVQLIKEFREQITDYFFISTVVMEKSGRRKWIEKAAGIEKSEFCEVNHFSFDDIIEQLDKFDFAIYDKIIVNLTGGTKVMTLAADGYFKELGSDIYYITGSNNNDYIKLYPGRKKITTEFKTKISISEYLDAYGFKYVKSEQSNISVEYISKIYSLYCDGLFYNHQEALSYLRSRRGKTVNKQALEENSLLQQLLKEIEYPIKEDKLNKIEVKFLSGEWFEEYIGLRLKKELSLSDDEIMIGVKIEKDIPNQVTNSVTDLLGDDIEVRDDNPNEIDVMFVFNNKFYTIECKTSIIGFKDVFQKKETNILGETIYKADSLKNKFGLFANSSIVTLSSFREYLNVDDRNTYTSRKDEMNDRINRANLSRIKLIDKDKLNNSSSIFELIK